MKKIKRYNDFLILEKFDNNIISELKKLGVTDKHEIEEYLYHVHRGKLAKYIEKTGGKFTYGILKALFLDAQEAKRKTDLKLGLFKTVYRVLPTALAPFFPILAIIGSIFSTTRSFNKTIAPILQEPGKNYSEFLQKFVKTSVKIAEGEIPLKDRFMRAFVVSDNLAEALKEDVLRDFALYLSKKMERKDQDEEVPEHFIENELKKYLNTRYDIEPEIPLKENVETKTVMFFHGYKGGVNEHRINKLKELGYNVVYPHIDYDLEWEKDKCKSIMDDLSLYNIDLYMGTSLGGYAAFILGMKNKKPISVINPALNRRESILNIKDFDFEYNISENIEVEVFFGKKDDLIPMENTLKFLDYHNLNYTYEVLDEMEHRCSSDNFNKILTMSKLV